MKHRVSLKDVLFREGDTVMGIVLGLVRGGGRVNSLLGTHSHPTWCEENIITVSQYQYLSWKSHGETTISLLSWFVPSHNTLSKCFHSSCSNIIGDNMSYCAKLLLRNDSSKHANSTNLNNYSSLSFADISIIMTHNGRGTYLIMCPSLSPRWVTTVNCLEISLAILFSLSLSSLTFSLSLSDDTLSPTASVVRALTWWTSVSEMYKLSRVTTQQPLSKHDVSYY